MTFNVSDTQRVLLGEIVQFNCYRKETPSVALCLWGGRAEYLGPCASVYNVLIKGVVGISWDALQLLTHPSIYHWIKGMHFHTNVFVNGGMRACVRAGVCACLKMMSFCIKLLFHSPAST